MSKRQPTGIETRKRSGRTAYRAVVYDKRTGKKLSKTFDTITAAKQWRADAIAALGAGRLSAERGPTLREAADHWLAGARAGHVRNRSGDHYKPSTIRAYERCLRLRVLPHFGAVRLGEIRTPDLQRMVDEQIAQGVAPPVVKAGVTALQAIYRRAVSRGVVPTNPATGLELPAIRSEAREIVSPAEAEELLAALAVEDRPLWATAFYAGLRRGELEALRWEDVNLASGVIHVRRGWDAEAGEVEPKSRKGRRDVPIPLVLHDVLVEHKMRAGEGRVFGAIRAAAERAAERWRKAGLRPLTLHPARHTYASFMIAAGVNAKALSTYMGHGSIAITLDLYGHLLPGNEAEAADLLDAYLAREAGGTSPETSPEGVRA